MRRAFTLIELLVVVAIIGLLVGLLLPSLAASRHQARAVVCRTRLRQLQAATVVYAQTNRDALPMNTVGNWSTTPDQQRGRDYPWPVLLWKDLARSRQAYACPEMELLPMWTQVRQYPNPYEYFEQEPGYAVSYEMKLDLGSTAFDPILRKLNLWKYYAYLNPSQLITTPRGNKLKPLRLLNDVRFPGQVMLFADRYWMWHHVDRKAVRQLVFVDGHCDRARDLAPDPNNTNPTEYFLKYWYYDSTRGRTDVQKW
ncbi:MAG: type II secretion system protein [Phycisphaerae bacterium]